MNIDKVERIQKLPNKKRVCAYARVSAEKEMSLHSLSYQISYYSQLIQSHRDWTYVGVYSDEGISGTKVDRPGFQKMMEDARAGKIDLILTKSVSRFARNTVVLLEACRELKNLGVDVYFEEQKINSMSYEGELMLTLQASFAQEEARSTSLNQRWRIKKDFEEGRLWGGANCVGYKIVNRKFVVDEATAPIVRRVYSLYLEGLGDHAIAKLLNEESVPSLKGGRWAQSHIKSMLTNVTYKGDLVLQKTYVSNYLSTGRHNNRGQKDSYLVENDHEPIIDKETFDKVQALRKKKAAENNTTQVKQKVIREFSGLLFCANCGRQYCFKKGPYKNHYMCATFLYEGKARCDAKQIPENILIDVTKVTLGLDEVTNSILRSKVQKILVKRDNILTYVLLSGKTIDAHWDDPKRSDGWTAEMKEAARKRAKAKPVKNGKWIKEGV